MVSKKNWQGIRTRDNYMYCFTLHSKKLTPYLLLGRRTNTTEATGGKRGLRTLQTVLFAYKGPPEKIYG